MTRGAQGVTRALVLAAGRGSRLQREIPKPLCPILGVPLLARTLFTLEQAGITDAYVVLGYQADRIRPAIEAIDRLTIRIHWIHNERWAEPNGVSVLAAESALAAGPGREDAFVLTMSDHVFDSAAVERLRSVAHSVKGVALVIDRRIDEVHDIEDATKVTIDGNRIVEIGKTLSRYDAVDTGVFLATRALFDALRQCEGEAGPSLSEGVQRLAREGAAMIADGTGLRWQDVDTPGDVDAAERTLLSRWPKPSDGPVARHLNRRVSTAISRRLSPTSITPNQISIATMVLSLIAAGFAAVGGYGAWLAAGLLFQFASILDGVDGELAILKFQSSRRGEWIDTLCDNLSYIAFLLGMIAGAYRAGLPPVYLWGGLVGLAAAALSLGNINFYLLRARKSGSALSVRYGYNEGRDVMSRVMQGLHFLGRRDLFSFVVLLLAVVGRLPLGLPLFGFGAAVLLLPATTHANVSGFFRARRDAGLDYGRT